MSSISQVGASVMPDITASESFRPCSDGTSATSATPACYDALNDWGASLTEAGNSPPEVGLVEQAVSGSITPSNPCSIDDPETVWVPETYATPWNPRTLGLGNSSYYTPDGDVSLPGIQTCEPPEEFCQPSVVTLGMNYLDNFSGNDTPNTAINEQTSTQTQIEDTAISEVSESHTQSAVAPKRSLKSLALLIECVDLNMLEPLLSCVRELNCSVQLEIRDKVELQR